MRTSVLAAKRALRTMIDGDAAFDGFLIRLGLPTEEPTQKERIYVLDNQPREYAPTADQGGLNEAYIVPVLIETRVFGDDRTETSRNAVEDRMENLVEALISLVDGDDHELLGTVYESTLERIVGPNTSPLVDGWICQCTVEFGVATRIF